MPQFNDLLKVQIDALKENHLALSERVAALEKDAQVNMQWANTEHLRIHQEIIEQGRKIRDDLVQEGKDMRAEVQSDIQEIKEMMKSRDSNNKQTAQTVLGPVLSAILLIVVDVVLHAMHII